MLVSDSSARDARPAPTDLDRQRIFNSAGKLSSGQLVQHARLNPDVQIACLPPVVSCRSGLK